MIQRITILNFTYAYELGEMNYISYQALRSPPRSTGGTSINSFTMIDNFLKREFSLRPSWTEINGKSHITYEFPTKQDSVASSLLIWMLAYAIEQSLDYVASGWKPILSSET